MALPPLAVHGGSCRLRSLFFNLAQALTDAEQFAAATGKIMWSYADQRTGGWAANQDSCERLLPWPGTEGQGIANR